MVPIWQIAEGIRCLYSRTCIDDTADLLCKCEVRSLSSSLPEGQDLQARLDMLDQRLSCKDIDGNICTLSRDIPASSDTSPAEQCLESLGVSTPMMSGGD